MIPVSQTYRDTLATKSRSFNTYISIKLKDNTVFELDNTKLRSFSYDEAVSSDNKFSMLGSVVINQCNIILDNISEDYSSYDFYNANVEVSLDYTLIDGTTERIRRGTYFVNEPKYTGSTIELVCLDYMAKFDRSYTESTLTYPATLGQIVANACLMCGVGLATSDFPHSNFSVSAIPIEEKTTFREIISWISQIAGCFAKCDVNGNLEIKWCNTDALNTGANGLNGGVFDDSVPLYNSGDSADGGYFNPWTTGYEINISTFNLQKDLHNLFYNYSVNIASSDIVITGIKVFVEINDEEIIDNSIALRIANGKLCLEKNPDIQVDFNIVDGQELLATSDVVANFYIENGDVYIEADESIFPVQPSINEDKTIEYMIGEEGYVITIKNNSFFTVNNAGEILSWLGEQLIGLRFRKADSYQLSDPTIEAGDVGILWDRKGRTYPIIITRTQFGIGKKQKIVCGAESPSKNNSIRYSNSEKSYLKLQDTILAERNERDAAITALETVIENAGGVYTTIVVDQATGGKIYYLHNQPTLEGSSIIWTMTAEAWSVSVNGQTNAGMTVDGNTIVNILTATGIDASWINAGTLLASYIRGGTLTLGGVSDENGILQVVDEAGVEIGNWNKDGFNVLKGSITSYVPTDATSYIKMDGAGIQGFINNELVYRLGLSIADLTQNVYVEEAVYGTKNIFAYDTDALTTAVTFSADVNSYNKYLFMDGLSVMGGGTLTLATGFGPSGTSYTDTDDNSSSILAVTTQRQKQDYFVILLGTGGNKIYSDNYHIILDPNDNSGTRSYVTVIGNFYTTGTKSRAVNTENYSGRALYSYEMPSPMFGDIGEGKTDEDGICIVSIDDIFAEATNLNVEYQVFLQKEGQGDLWVEDKKLTHFTVRGTPNLKFSWEVKAKQRYYELERTELFEFSPDLSYNQINQYEDILIQEQQDLLNEQEVLLNETA